MPNPTPGQFRCAKCKGVFNKEWSDEEAKAEFDHGFPGEPLATAVVVCDDCYRVMTAISPLMDLAKHKPSSN